MTWELLTQLGTFTGVVAAIVFGFLGWLRSRTGETQKVAAEETQTAIALASVGTKLENMADDFTEIKRDVKGIAADGRAFREGQIRHESRIEALEHRVTRLELTYNKNGGLTNEA